MTEAGYYRFPTIHSETIVFVSEDDLWSAPAAGGPARRLTSNLGEVSYPSFSPDGSQLAFVGREEGQSEVYVMPAVGGPARRLTYLASRCRVLGWDRTGTHVIFNSTYGQILDREIALFRVAADCTNGAVEPLPYGPARSVSFGGEGQVVLGRNTGDPARWKRYRGGTTGHLWIDLKADGAFARLLPDVAGNIASPMWIETEGGPRIFFVSDHEGISNLYSCRPDGSELRRHTDHEEYYVRNTSTDGRRIVYHAGGDLYMYEVATDSVRKVAVEYHSPRVQRNRRFVSAAHYLNMARLHPSGQAIALTTRGKAFAFFNFDGPVVQLGKRDGVRYRLGDWLSDGQRLVVVSDELGEELLEVYDAEPGAPPRRLEGLDIGRPLALKASPVEDKVALVNHRHELMVVDLKQGAVTTVDRSPYRRMAGFDWSPDGRWLAYGYSGTVQTTELRLCRLGDGGEEQAGDGETEASGPLVRRNADGSTVYRVTQPVLHDIAPSFDPEGKHLYFLSHREFNPVYDGLHFDLGFPWGMRPYLLTLQADLPNPFVPHPELGAMDEEDEDEEAGEEGDEQDAEQGDGEEDGAAAEEADSGAEGEADDDDGGEDGGETGDGEATPVWRTAPPEGPSLDTGLFEHTGGGDDKREDKAKDKGREKRKGDRQALEIDLENIERRIFPFPVPDGRYGQIAGIKGKAIFTDFPIEGQLDSDEGWSEDEEPENGVLRAYTFADYRDEVLADNVNWFDLAFNGKKLLYGSGTRLRVIGAGEKAPTGGGHPRKTGWVDLSRVKVSVSPQSEWEQMFREAWRLQRDHFWTEDMAQVDWQTVYHRYFPLISRVSTRGEFSDLMWEMQGELGTSHAYEYGGDYRPGPRYSQGFLGAAFTWDGKAGGYRVGSLLVGDPWDARATSPLAEPGMDVQPGDLLVAINGQPLDEETGPAQLLVNQARQTVLLSFAARQEGDGLHHIGVRALASESLAHYRAWVEANRRRVHAATGGRVGYVHIPDMGPGGYAEFHRGYLAEVDRDALIVDVRYNGGGHVSQLILEKLARRRIGYDLSRWGGLMPYPQESVAGPLVALTNEHAGSDGDIFCHSFKLLKLGPLVGKRTWGGVIGISPHHPLVDGTVTTQPEFSFWFEDVGWNVENYGTEPDIEVENAPQDYQAGADPQLERAVAEALRLLEERPVLKPDLATRPSRALPRLPAR